MVHTDPLKDPDFELDEIKSMYQSMSTDLPDFPRPAFALLQYARTGETDYEELHLLPNRYLLQNYDKGGENFVRERQYERAIRLYKRRLEIEPGHNRLKQLEVDALFCTAEWENLKITPSGYSDIMSEINQYYYMQVVQASRSQWSFSFKSKRFEQFLEWTFKTNRNAKEFKELDSNITFPKLATTFIFVKTREGDSASTVSNDLEQTADKILRQTFKTETPESFNHSKIKALFLFSLLSHSKKLTFTFTSGLVKLDLRWLDDMQPYLKGSQRIIIERTRSILVNAEYRKSIKYILGRMDAMQIDFSKNPINFTITIMPDNNWQRLFQLFRGPDSGYRDPIKFALLDAFPKRSDHRELAV